jgi:hypothetical protein
MDLYPDEDDPIIVELRRFRREYSARFGGDLKLMAEDRERNAANWPGGCVSFAHENDEDGPPTPK